MIREKSPYPGKEIMVHLSSEKLGGRVRTVPQLFLTKRLL